MSYCIRCGKENFNDGEICNDCMSAQNSVAVEQKGSYTTGLSGAIWGASIGTAGLVLVIIDMFVAAMGVASQNAGIKILAVLMLSASIACAVVGMVLGVKAITTFRVACANGDKKPIATLIVGIESVVMAGGTLIYAMFVGVFVLVMLFAAPVA